MTAPLTAAFLFSLTVCALVLGGLLRRDAALAAWQDLPNGRSLHAAPVPRVGGLGIHAGWAATCAMQAALGHGLALSGAALAGIALVFCVSLLDDRRPVPAAHRLAVQAVAAVLLVAPEAAAGLQRFVGSDAEAGGAQADALRWTLAAGLVLGTLWLVNLYNFMDGSDGLAGGMAVAGFGTYAIVAAPHAPALALLAAAVAGSAAGFLRFNFPPARLFMGDAGSAPLGFMAAALGIAGVSAGAWDAWLPPLAFLPFIVDATFTLLLRLSRGERVWEAHREHGYQKLVRMGWSHRRTALAWYLAMGCCAAIVLGLRHFDRPLQWGGLAVAAALALALRVTIEFVWRRRVAHSPGA